ncbi:hypothetical protein [Shouchella xiaoxiensis]|uniref:hypothetical protein n=1 Tax=Shouchella xiaoxiensis TaxID=766895 RepID=UPI00195C6640|nr:hypothetical protein [Shouchella xiaoxiensis]
MMLIFVEKSLNPSAVWLKVASNEALTGVEQIIGKLKDSKEKPSEITILSVITHGKFASIDGVVNYSNGKPLSFCDVFTFTSASNKGVVKEVRSYHIRN